MGRFADNGAFAPSMFFRSRKIVVADLTDAANTQSFNLGDPLIAGEEFRGFLVFPLCVELLEVFAGGTASNVEVEINIGGESSETEIDIHTADAITPTNGQPYALTSIPGIPIFVKPNSLSDGVQLEISITAVDDTVDNLTTGDMNIDVPIMGIPRIGNVIFPALS